MRKLAVAAASLIFGLAGAAVTVTPARAEHTYVEIYNHGSSVTGIRVYDVNKGWDFGRTLQPGENWNFYNPDRRIRIDVDIANRGVNSWKWGHGSPGSIVYKPCYEYRSDSAANPSATWTDTIVVRNYWGSSC
jgi:hypothetical protein